MNVKFLCVKFIDNTTACALTNNLSRNVVIKCLIGRHSGRNVRKTFISLLYGDRKDARKSTRYEIMKAYSN